MSEATRCEITECEVTEFTEGTGQDLPRDTEARGHGGAARPLSARRASRGWSSPTSADTSKGGSWGLLVSALVGELRWAGRRPAGGQPTSAASSPFPRYLRSSVLNLVPLAP